VQEREREGGRERKCVSVCVRIVKRVRGRCVQVGRIERFEQGGWRFDGSAESWINRRIDERQWQREREMMSKEKYGDRE
jgi:hypothetical protein